MRITIPVALVLSLLTAREAGAQSADAQTLATAQALYDGASKAMDAKDYKSACPSLEEVVRLVPDGFGAKVTLAECYEASGRLASAWTMYTLVDNLATKPNQLHHRSTAHRKAEALKPRLSRLTITVTASTRALSGLEIKRDEVSVGAAQWGVPLPVDKGKHVIVATAKGKQRLEKAVEIDEDGVERSLEISDLADLPIVAAAPIAAAPPPPSPRPEDPKAIARRREVQRTLAFVSGGLGIAALGVGAGFGIQAIVKKNQSNSPADGWPYCHDGDYCQFHSYDPERAGPGQLRQEGLTAAARSTALFVAGGVLLGAGVTLFFTAPRAPTGDVKIAASPRGVEIVGAW